MSEHTHSGKHEAHRKLVERLRQHAEDVSRMVTGLDEAALGKRLSPDKWSIKELLCHLDRVHQVFAERIEAVVAQDNPIIANYDPENDRQFEKMVSRPASDSLASFLQARRQFADRLEALSPAEWHRPGQHPQFPHYDVHFQIEYMVHHEAHHIYQMYQRRTQFGKMPH